MRIPSRPKRGDPDPSGAVRGKSAAVCAKRGLHTGRGVDESLPPARGRQSRRVEAPFPNARAGRMILRDALDWPYRRHLPAAAHGSRKHGCDNRGKPRLSQSFFSRLLRLRREGCLWKRKQTGGAACRSPCRGRVLGFTHTGHERSAAPRAAGAYESVNGGRKLCGTVLFLWISQGGSYEKERLF